MIKAFKFIIFIFLNSYLYSQNDSTLLLLKKLNKTNSVIEKTYINLSLTRNYLNRNIDSAIYFLNQTKILHPTSKAYQGKDENIIKTKILNLEGEIQIKIGKLNDAEKTYYDLLTLYLPYLTIQEKAYAYLQLGVINHYQSNAVSSLRYYNKSYKIYDSLNDLKGTSECLNNMGVIFYGQGETDKAIEYLEKSLTIRKNTSTKSEIADLLENLGSMHLQKNHLEIAGKYFNEGLSLYSEEKNTWGIAYSLKNLAKFNIKTKQYDEALKLCQVILEKHTGSKDSSSIAMINAVLSEVYYLKEDYSKSIEYGMLAYSIGQKINVAWRIYEASKILKDAYKDVKNYEEALKFQTIYFAMRDSLTNNEVQKKSLLERLEHEKEVERVSFEKDILIKESEANRKNLILIFISVGFALILIFSGLLFKKFKETTKQKLIIEKQKQEVEIKQKEILDSINYAKRIQEAILPSIDALKSALKNAFVLYIPKDVVAGDFYWMEIYNNKIFFAAADCTGHGVPGALVSVVCSNALTKALLEEGIDDTGKLLDRTRELVIEKFAKSGEEVKDGMDISLCAIEFANNSLQWSGANNPLYVIRNNKLIETKPDKQPIGKYAEVKPFTAHTFSLQTGDSIYIFTDGFADQFGGPKGKKYNYKTFRNKLLELASANVEEQKSELEKTFFNWKGELEQVDDVCVIGIRV